MDQHSETEILEAVRLYCDAVKLGDGPTAQRALDDVARLCLPAVAKAALKTIKPAEHDIDDVVALGNLVFVETLPEHMLLFDPTKVGTLASGRRGTFAGWVLYAYPKWVNTLRRELEKASDTAGINVADQQMQRIYHGCRERFTAQHGRDWSPAEARQHIERYLYETTRDRYVARNPDWDDAQIEAAVHERITKDGHQRTLRELEEVVRLQAAANTASLDAPLGDDPNYTLASQLSDERPVEDDPGGQDVFTDWARVATFTMSGRLAKTVAEHLDDPDVKVPADAMTQAREMLANPLAQFIVLGDLGSLYEPELHAEVGTEVHAREQLVLAANLL